MSVQIQLKPQLYLQINLGSTVNLFKIGRWPLCFHSPDITTIWNWRMPSTQPSWHWRYIVCYKKNAWSVGSLSSVLECHLHSHNLFCFRRVSRVRWQRRTLRWGSAMRLASKDSPQLRWKTTWQPSREHTLPGDGALWPHFKTETWQCSSQQLHDGA